MSSLMTMVVSFTLSAAKELPSSMAETKLHVPCSPSKSLLVAESSGFMTTFYRFTASARTISKIRGDATSHQRFPTKHARKGWRELKSQAKAAILELRREGTVELLQQG